MTTDTPAHDPDRGNAALAALPSAGGRSHPQNFALDRAEAEEDERLFNDSTSIGHGAKAVVGRVAFSPNRVAISADVLARYEQGKKQLAEREAAEARELANLTAWNAQRTVIAGVAMTNAEAQDARQRVLDNADRYADSAVRNGHIKADEKDAFIETMRRQKELEERRGRGTITAAEEREAEAIKRSRMGGGLDAATAHAYREREINLSATMRRETGNDVLRRSDRASVADAAVFQDYEATKPKVFVAPLPARGTAVSTVGLEL